MSVSAINVSKTPTFKTNDTFVVTYEMISHIILVSDYFICSFCVSIHKFENE